MDILIRHTPKGFFKVIAYSFALHVIVISVGLIYFKAGPRKIFFTPVYTVNLVDPAAIRSPKAGPKPAKAGVKGKAAAKEKADTKALKTSKLTAEKAQKGVSLDESLKKIAENVRKEEERKLLESRIEELKKKEAASTDEVRKSLEEIKKSIAEAGTSNSATDSGRTPAGPARARQAVTSANLEVRYPAYLSAIRDKVQENWIYPETFKSGKPSVIVSIKIARDGELIDIWVEQSSGLAAFDESLVNAVKKAAPFPPLPEDFDGAVFETGLRFCPECAE